MEYKPTVKKTRLLKKKLSTERWEKRVSVAVKRLAKVEAVVGDSADSMLSRETVREKVPGEHWSNIRRWVTWYWEREGEAWERMLDLRSAPSAWETPESWKAIVRVLGRQDPQPSLAKLRSELVAEHGTSAKLCDKTLRNILREAGLWEGGSRGGLRETVTELSGGGGLVLLTAAASESGVVTSLSRSIIELAKEQESREGEVAPEPDGRDDLGRLTVEYNRKRRELAEASQVDPIYRSVEESRQEKDLSRLQVGSMRVATLENRLRSVIALPLVSDRRGMWGLDGPMGGWLEVFSSYAYKTRTAEKTLSELKYLGAGEVMWESHAQTWWECSRKWAGEGWRQLVTYIDATQDPWWTEHYAMSGRVARTGRVQPCLTRVLVTSGPGVPIYAEVISGTGKMSTRLMSGLDAADKAVGEGEVGRITVVDAECSHLKLLEAFAQDPRRDIITVLKGPSQSSKELEDCGEWQPFRERDLLREAMVNLEPKSADGLRLRVVEMIRSNSRYPTSTWFVTTASPSLLITTDVAEAYLSRWPYQEDLFRRGRNSAGLERSHGYGVSKVINVAVLTKRERATKAVQRENNELMAAGSSKVNAELALKSARARLKERRQNGEKLDQRHKYGVRNAERRLRENEKRFRETKRQQQKALQEQRKQQSMPDEIYVRDTALDSVTTCLKMALLTLLEFVCREYFDGWRMMPRTFAEAFVPLPVTIRESPHRIVYEVAPNPRDPKMTALLDSALQRVTKRKIKVGKRLLVARLRDDPD